MTEQIPASKSKPDADSNPASNSASRKVAKTEVVSSGDALMEGRTRKRGRESLRRKRSQRVTTMLPSLHRKLPLVEPMDEEQIRKIDAASMDILEQVGVVFRDPEAIEDWQSVGAEIRDGDRVHLDRHLVRELIASIPANFTYHARNPDHNLSLIHI